MGGGGGGGGGGIKWKNRESKTFLPLLFAGVKLHLPPPLPIINDHSLI